MIVDTSFSLGPAIGSDPVNALLSPIGLERFLAEYWTRDLCLMKGTPGRFADLLSWPALNEMLAGWHSDPARLKLVSQGRAVSRDSFVRPRDTRRGASSFDVDAAALSRALDNGATLVIEGLDDIHAPLRRLAASLEQRFHERVQINAYVSWKSTQGFNTHWDGHDILIVQVCGRKRWQFFGPTRPFPLPDDPKVAGDAPTAVTWTNHVEDGDVLYVPRGWWHLVEPCNEPTVHLACGITSRTGIDLVGWLMKRLRESELFRRDLPRFQAPEARRAHARRLREAFAAQWTDDDLDRFLAEINGEAEPRPSLQLPHSVYADVPLTPDARVALTCPRVSALQLQVDGDRLRLFANGRDWTFALQAQPILERLLEGGAMSLGAVHRATSGTLSFDVVERLIRDLRSSGLVEVSHDASIEP